MDVAAGDVVRLRSGRQPMVVVELVSTDLVRCKYLSDANDPRPALTVIVRLADLARYGG